MNVFIFRSKLEGTWILSGASTLSRAKASATKVCGLHAGQIIQVAQVIEHENGETELSVVAVRYGYGKWSDVAPVLS